MPRANSPINIRAEFLKYLQTDTIRRTNFEGRTFYHPAGIRRWMSQRPDATTSSNAYRLFASVYDDATMYPKAFPPSKKEEIDQDPLLLALLVQMECGHMLHIFRDYIHDHSLATAYTDHMYSDIERALQAAKTILPNQYCESRYRGVTNEFDKQRWAFCPALDVFTMTKATIEEQSILPFFYIKRINEGGTAIVHHHKVHVDLIDDYEALQQALKPSKAVDQKTGIECYEFAVKSYSPEYDDIYNMESEAFRGFDGTRDPAALGVVKYLGEYTRQIRGGTGGSITEETRHIMLEFGEQDLDMYLADTYPPVLNEEIIAFWVSLFQVAETLQNVHQFEHIWDGKVQKYVGWHGDIKPENILRVRKNFKLADFGFTKFQKSEMGKIAKTYILGGTRTYGAPERDNSEREDSRTLHSTTIDTWSMGCVFSAVATWVILGSQAYLNYNARREMAQADLKERRKNDTTVHASNCDDAFHDGIEVLSAVIEWHDYLRNSVRRADTITRRVLDLVESDMLVRDPNQRLSSKDLCSKLSQIVCDAERDYKQRLKSGDLKKESFATRKALLELDKQAPIYPTPKSRPSKDSNLSQTSTIPKHYRARKSERIENILHGKTANREQVLKAADDSRTDNPETIYELPEDDVSPRTLDGPSNAQVYDNREIPLDGGSSNPRHRRSNTNEPVSVEPGNLRHTGTILRQQIPIVKEYHRLLQQWEGNRTIWNIFQGGVPRDSYLAQFISNRDIIFVVDNAASMGDHWHNVTTTALTLAMKIGPLDKDGLDLVFAIGEPCVHNVSGAKGWNIRESFAKALESASIDMAKHTRNSTDMAATLSKIFDKYTNHSKKQTLIVLTDGLWEGSDQNDDVETVISTFIRNLKQKLNKSERRWFSIQFVSFGQNEDALRRLQRLDDDLRKTATEDVVDSKPWDSPDVDTLILGSIHQGMDGQDPSTPMAPSRATSQVLPPSPAQSIPGHGSVRKRLGFSKFTKR